MEEENRGLSPGDVVAGRYRVEALLGQGGFGNVYRAAQLDARRPVALKVMLPEAIGNEEALARFRREAELAQRLVHPNTVRIYDFGETEAGLPFIAFELLRGRPLDEVLREERTLPPAKVARIAAQILRALAEAHGLGIIHRDIKPSNVFLTDVAGDRDFVKVLDFGVAKNVRGGKAITVVGAIVGTPSYMPPEQLRGGTVSPASDVYALGLVMGEMLSGQPAYGGAIGATLIVAQLSDTPAPMPPSVTGSPLGPIVLRAIQKRPEARFASAAEMLAQIEPVLLALAPDPRAPAFASAPTVVAFPAAPSVRAPLVVVSDPGGGHPRNPGPVFGAPPPPAEPPAAPAPAPTQVMLPSRPKAAPAPPSAKPDAAAAPGGRRTVLVGVFAGAISVLIVLIAISIVTRVMRRHAPPPHAHPEHPVK